MFSFIFGSKKSSAPGSASHPSKHRSSRSRDIVTWPAGGATAADGDYDDVSLEGGAAGAPGPSRQSFSAPTATRGSFVGGEDGSSNAMQSSYPPLPSFSRPSNTNGYPSLRTTFDRLSTVLAEQSPSLLDSLSPPLESTDPALSSLLHAISPYYLPPAVLESYALHDGQDPFAGGGASTAGLVWGLWWMPMDQVEQEWKFWRRLEDAGGGMGMGDAFSASTEGAKLRTRTHPYVEDAQGEDEDGGGGGTNMHGMSSFPEGWVRKRYSHPGWLPLLSDRCGNYIGVDLDPPPPLPSSSSTASGGRSGRAYGQPGQVIAFGREIDEKVVLFPGDGAGGWGRFLAAFVDDLEKGEFARLGEGEELRRAGANGWGDEESQGSGGSSSDEWDGGDGIGERSYFDGDRYGDEGEEGATGVDTQAWVLRSEYRKQLSQEDGGGLIGVIAERSRRKWKSLGVGGRSSVPASFPEPKPRAPLSVNIPSSVDEAGPSSSVTVRASSPALISTDSARQSLEARPESLDGQSENSNRAGDIARPLTPSAVELVLSPPSPTRAARFPDPLTPAKDEFSHPPAPRSPDLLDDGRPAFPSRGLQDRQKRKSRKPPPPPPAALDLPTMLDLDDDSSQSVSVYGNGGSSPSAVALDAFDEPRRTSTSSIRSFVAGTPTRSSLLPTHSSSSGTLPTIHSSQTTNQTGSTTALVEHQELDMSTSLAGLGIDSPELDRHTMEAVVVDENRSPSPALSAGSRGRGAASPALSDQPYEMAPESSRE